MARTDWQRPSKTAALGALIVVFVAPVAGLVAAGLARAAGGGSFWFPSPTLGFLDPSLAVSGAPLDRIVARVVVDLVLFGIAIVYYLLVAVVAFGIALIALGVGRGIAAASREDLASVRERARRLAGDLWAALASRAVQAAVVAASALVLLSLSPYRWVLLEAALLLAIVTLGATLLGGLALAAYHRSPGPFVDRVLVYPLAALALLVPPAVAGLISPTFGPGLRRLVGDVAAGTLDAALAAVGAGAAVRESIGGRGLDVLLVWLAVQLAAGLVIGALALLAGRIAGGRDDAPSRKT